ncbi:hypothetical protein [Bacillus pumilus]|uniref:hypothetical protein n=1 Tax=Bacillus pumilus TaxID=1408 RepID=UPI0011A50F64|nr:hypothetical protein [Bacillus pumilus]
MGGEIFGGDYGFLKKEEVVSLEEMEEVATVFGKEVGVVKIGMRGGEGLMGKDLGMLIEKV